MRIKRVIPADGAGIGEQDRLVFMCSAALSIRDVDNLFKYFPCQHTGHRNELD